MDDLISRNALLEKVQYRIDTPGIIGSTVRDMVATTRRIIEEEPAVAYNLSQTESRWIPAAERLPGMGELVLVCAGDHVDVNYREGDSTWGFDYDAPITHWMPLPEPPSVSEVGV